MSLLNQCHLLITQHQICKLLNPSRVRLTSRRRTGSHHPIRVLHSRATYLTKSLSQQVVRGDNPSARLSRNHKRLTKFKFRMVKTNAKLRVNRAMTMGQTMMINQKNRKKISQRSKPRQLMWAICWRLVMNPSQLLTLCLVLNSQNQVSIF